MRHRCTSSGGSVCRGGRGRNQGGVDCEAIEAKPVHHFFLIVAPPMEVSNQYLPVWGKIAQFAKDPDVPDRLGQLGSPEDFLRLLEQQEF